MAFSLGQRARPIVLTGIMGVGKTSTGRLLAARLALPFHDSDEAVEAAAGYTIAHLFERQGEAAFREQEHRALAALLNGPRAVIASGGGAVLDARTRALLAERAWTIWLEAEPATLTARLAGSTDRPLLSDENPEETLRRLLADRAFFYAQADLRLPVGGRTPDQVVDAIIAAMSQPSR